MVRMPLRRLHAEHVVGGGLGADEDDVLACVAGGHRIVGGEDDLAARRPGRSGQPLAERLGVVAGGEADVEELAASSAGFDAVERSGDGEAVAWPRRLRWTAVAMVRARSPGMAVTLVTDTPSTRKPVPGAGTVAHARGLGAAQAAATRSGLTSVAEQVHRPLRLVEGHVAGRDLEDDVLGQTRRRGSPAEPVADLFGGAAPGERSARRCGTRILRSGPSAASAASSPSTSASHL